jgi:hypothetical protein
LPQAIGLVIITSPEMYKREIVLLCKAREACFSR